MIPDAAVEAAARAFIEHGTLLPALEAAAPHMLAEAWEAGASAQAAAYGMDKDAGPNPYGTQHRGADA